VSYGRYAHEVIRITDNQRCPQLSSVEFKNDLLIPLDKKKSSILQLYEDLSNGFEIEFDFCNV
jgi:hypothetical protein